VEHEGVLLGFIYFQAGFGQRQANSDHYDSIGAKVRRLRGRDRSPNHVRCFGMGLFRVNG